MIDLKLIFLTIIAIVSKQKALGIINSLLLKLNADEDVIRVSLRHETLVPSIPPGLNAVVESRQTTS